MVDGRIMHQGFLLQALYRII